MWPALDPKLQRFRDLEAQLGDPAVASDPSRFSAVAKEHGSLSKLVKPYLEFQALDTQIRESEGLLADPELGPMAEEELAALRPRHAALREKIEEQLLIEPGEDFDKLIVEIRAGTGGDEAALFAGDLYEMYVRYARAKGWRVEEIDASLGEAGGFKEVVFSVAGDEVYQHLRYESGGHRVQRVPKTETQGRIHTSLATVGVMPEPDEVNVTINPADLDIEVMRAGGAGGQHVNKTESAVRIWYRKGTADQIEVKCQDGRSQHKNKEQAMRVLRSRVYEAQQAKVHRERSEMRRTLIGGGDRGERIRTYNFPDARVTDHRVGLSVYKLADVLAGNLDLVVGPLREHDKKERLGGK